MKTFTKSIIAFIFSLLVFGASAQQINKAEYFFDTDPGVGNATNLSISVAGDSVVLNQNIATTGLGVGFHRLFVRFRNTAGNWGSTEDRQFYVYDTTSAPALPTMANVTYGEYFFNTDPGIGLGKNAKITNQAIDSVNSNFNIVLSGTLPPLTNTIGVRYQDANGKWGVTSFNTFNICNSPLDVPNVTGKTTYCSGDTIQLSSLNVVGASSYYWTGPNGFTSTAQNIRIVNATPNMTGLYKAYGVRVGGGVCDTSSAGLITISVMPYPNVGFTTNKTSACFNSQNFIFTDTTQAFGNPLTYNWDMGNGESRTTPSFSYNYTGFGSFTVTLTATNANGCAASISQPINVNPNASVGFSTNNLSQCLNTNSFVFTDTSTVAIGSYTRSWNFGDLSTSSGNPATKSYAASGSYTVKLVVTTDQNCKDSVSRVVVVNPKPSVGFTITNAQPQCVNGNSYTFNDTSTTSSGTLTRIWSFGDTTTSTASNPTKSYTAAGIYTIKLVEIVNLGCRDSVTKTVQVLPKPNVGFTTNNPTQCFNGNSFVFTDTSTIASGTMNRLWNLGDLTTSTANPVTKSYLASGSYTVKLVMTSLSNCRDSVSKVVTVNPKPSVGFTINNPTQCFNSNSFVFSDTSTTSSGTLTRQWSFGDTTTSTATNPTKNYSASGTYNVKLISIVNLGCRDSVTKTVTVNAKPNVGFTINNPSQCSGSNSFVYTDTSTIASGTMTRLWNLGDLTTSTVTPVTKSYVASAVYTVKLVLTSNNNCKDSISKTVTVNPKPNVGFIINNSAQCVNANSFIFNDTTTTSIGTLSRLWNFGDTTTGTSVIFNKIYTTAGTYSVKLVTSINGLCKDSVTKTVTVYPKPKVGFTINNPSQCAGSNSFVYTDTSTIASGTMTRLWNLGDLSTSVVSPITKSYGPSAVYTIKLVETSNNNCKDSVSKTVVVSAKPNVGYTVSATAACVNGSAFNFQDTSTTSSGTLSSQWSFGDGGTSFVASPSKSYSADGTYQVKLVSVVNGICKDSVTKTITVYAKPQVGFLINSLSQCLPSPNFFTSDTTKINSGTYTRTWVVNGVSTGNSGATNSYQPTSAGSYTIRLVAVSNNACKDSLTKTVSVNTKPITGSITGSFSVIQGASALYNVSPATGSTFQWFITNGTITSGNGTNAIGVTWGSSVGIGTLKVVETNASGCLGDTVSLNVSIGNVFLTVLPTSLNYSDSGGVQTVYAASNASWVVLNSQPSWISLDKTGSTGNDSVVVTAAVNPTSTPRSGFLTFIANGVVNRIVTINQLGFIPDSLTLTSDTLHFLSGSGNKLVGVFTNKTYIASTSAQWLTLLPSSGSGNTAMIVSAAANSGPIRTTTINVLNGNLLKTIYVIQDSIPDMLSFDHDTIYPSYLAGNSLVILSSNRNWTASSNQTWARVNPASGSMNGGIIIATDSNPGVQRVALITVVANFLSKNITVIQGHNAVGIGTVSAVNPSIVIYPNPGNGTFMLQTEHLSGLKTITILNGLGAKVYEQHSEEDQIDMELDALAAGMYFVKIKSPEGEFIRKLVVH